jgi:UDP-glucose:(glucosyl)LPS alpha-1,2-glucosyltransferase
MQINELNVNANGGTELVTRGLFERLGDSLDGIQLISSRVRDIERNKKRILHLHDLPEDPESQHLSNDLSRNRFSALVFVSYWQMQQYIDKLGIPNNHKCFVIHNAIEPIPQVKKPDPTDKVKLIYTSTPHRGLEILVPVFENLYEKFDGKLELDVFSSFNIYGWPERDKVYEPLFDRCRNHPGINYHGFQPNSVVRQALQQAHIFAYPSMWKETFCLAMVEAMSAGCLCVHSDLAALPEISAGLNHMYRYSEYMNEHAGVFHNNLEDSIHFLLENKDNMNFSLNKFYVDHRYSWDAVIPQWKSLISFVKND